ncbi:MAG: hypothetical protein ABI396_14930 [Ktedonobacteraceae bacterium]
MRTQSSDTSPEAERVQIELIRKAPITKRVALMAELSQFLIEAHKQGIRQTHPNANEKEVGLIFVANNYSQTLADKLKVYPPATRKATVTSHTNHLFDALTPIVAALELLGVAYYLSGAFASAFYGTLSTAIEAAPAETLQFVANLQLEHIQPFSALLANSYYINSDAVRHAIQRKGLFNLIHLETILPINISIPKARLFDQEELRRVQLQPLMKEARPFYIASPEGTIFNKLEWYKMGGGVSDRQWNDILGVLKVQGTNLDMLYLHRWAIALEVVNLLQTALVDAGLAEGK